MMNLLRSKTFVRIVLWVVVVGFVGWLGYDVGYGGPQQDRATNVGEVNGVEIDIPSYRERLNAELQRRRDPADPDALDRFAVDQDVWERQVEEIIIQQAIAEYNITVSPQEVAMVIISQPLPGLEEAEVFQTDGRFDQSKYRSWYQTLDHREFFRLTSQAYGRGMTLTEYEGLIGSQIAQNRLRQRISSPAITGEADVRRYYARNNEKVEVRTAYVRLLDISDSEITVSEEEILSYYEDHSGDYRRKAQAQLAYVAMSKAPTAKDLRNIKAEVDTVYARLQRGADFAGMAFSFSEHEPTRPDSGFLGTMPRGSLPEPQDTQLFSLSVGQFTEPVQTSEGWEIYYVERMVRNSNADTADVRHILLKTDRASNATLDSLRTIADSLNSEVATMEDVAKVFGLRVDTTHPFETSESSPFRRLRVRLPAAQLVYFAHNHKIGDVASTYESKDYIIASRLVSYTEEGARPFSEVRTAIERAVQSEKKLEAAALKLERVTQSRAAGGSLEDAATSAGVQYSELAPFTRNEGGRSVGAGARNEFTGAAFSLQQPGQISGVVKVAARGAYIIELVSREFDDTGLTPPEKARIKSQLTFQLQQSLWQHWLDHRKANAKIVDRRQDYFGY